MLLTSLIFAVVILAFVSAIITSGVGLQSQHRMLRADTRAVDAAESGINAVLGTLNSTDALILLDKGWTAGVIQGSGERAVRFDATIAPGLGDGIDNDLDGLTDEEDEEDIFEIVSTGWADGISRTVRVTCLARYKTPPIPSAVYVGDPAASLRMDSNALLVSGRDVGLDGSTTGQLVPGLGVTGNPDQYKDTLKKSVQNNIVGLGGSPSIYQVDSIDLQVLVEEAARSANVTLESGSAQQPSEEGAWGTLTRPAILFGSGDVHISGGATGSGILVVDGNLKIDGKFEWHGLVVARGEVSFGGGGGQKRLSGGLIVESGLNDDPLLTSDVQVTGTVDLLFSEQTLKRISKAFAVYVVLNWREGPTPSP